MKVISGDLSHFACHVIHWEDWQNDERRARRPIGICPYLGLHVRIRPDHFFDASSIARRIRFVITVI
jgi:hypothetical protein